MRRWSFGKTLVIGLFTFSVLFIHSFPASCESEKTPLPWGVILKIKDIEKTLTFLDSLMEPSSGLQSPTALIRGLSQGTYWIDSQRAIVIGINFENQQPKIQALIPFNQPNEGFRNTYMARTGADYYIVSLPPGEPVNLTTTSESTLVYASSDSPNKLITLDIAASQLVDQAKPRLENALKNIEQQATDPNSSWMNVGPKDVSSMAHNFLEILKQIEIFSIQFDASDQWADFNFNVISEKNTRLANLLSTDFHQSYWNNYRPRFQVNFRCERFDAKGLMSLFGEAFGDLYTKMGIDFNTLIDILSNFTGETAGGVSYSKSSIDFEVISVFHEGVSTENFLENTYLPWIENYGKNAAQAMVSQTGQKADHFFSRSSESRVAGLKVVGIKTAIPITSAKTQDQHSWLSYEMRMTVYNNMLMMASDDRRLEKLIETVKNIQKTPYQGPLAEADVDLSSYIKGIKELTGGSDPKLTIPKLERMIYRADLKNGNLYASTNIKRSDIRKMLVFYKEVAARSVNQNNTLQSSSAKNIAGNTVSQPKNQVKTSKKAESNVQSPGKEPEKSVYWFDKGSLLATYGNDKEAIKCYRKAIALNPNYDEAFFQLGVSYGEIDEFDQALSSINRAIALQPEKGVYHYGRARLHLLMNQPEKAFEDMKTAASLGNSDALDYLQRH